MPVKIMVADDHDIFRQGLISLLASHQDWQITGQAASGIDIMLLIEKNQPDLVILDISMPKMNGIETATEIKRKFPGIKICTLSMHKRISFVREMLKAGASSYVLKDNAFSDLETAIEMTLKGGNFISPEIQYNPGNETTESGLMELTSREREVLQLLAEGQNNKEIADRLCISVKTIETHRSRIMTKTGLRTLQELTRFAIQQGLTPL